MYNLLVTAHQGAWDLPAYEIERSRFLEYSAEKEATLFKVLTAENIELLKSFPCLFTYEGNDEEVRVGYLRAVKERGPVLLLEYTFDPDIPVFRYSQIAQIASALDIRKWEMSRTHWAVKDENLFQRLHGAGLIDASFISSAGRGGRLEELRFKVAFSFPGELRGVVSQVVSRVKEELPRGTVFYDDDFTAQLARPNLDSLLQTVYLNNDKVPFGYGKADIESFPLERLLNVFSKLNTDTALQARLNKLREERNHIAHRSLIITMGSLYDPGAVEDKYIEYVDLEDEVLECLKLVLKEAKALKERTSSAA